jgi:two-component system, OmpR family, sensor histidine kinase ChvG
MKTRSLRELASRIVFRILALNVLLVFLPLAGILYLDVYEDNLVVAQRQSMAEMAGAVATVLEPMDRERAVETVAALPVGSDVRIRLVGPGRAVLADTAGRDASGAPYRAYPDGDPRQSALYRLGTWLLRRPVRWLRDDEYVPSTARIYESSTHLDGAEVLSALAGEPASFKRIFTGDPPTVILYQAAPATLEDAPAAVLVSQTTHGVLEGLYDIRLRTFQIFLVALVVAVALSLWIAATIVRPIRALRREAGGILDRRGRLRGGFTGSEKPDEIGELSRALERLTGRLEGFQQFNESFASDISHEFKNPLASIRTATELLEDAATEAERARFRGVIDREVVRMERLLESLREVATIDARLESEEVETVDLRGLLAALVEGYRYRERDRVRFTFEAAPGPAPVEASEDRLYQVFSNLLDNAAGFSPDGAPVVVSLARAGDGDGWEIRVCDRGPGIPEAHRDRVFDRFFTYREHRNGNSHDGSFHSGLGLAIVRAVVEGYGGDVRLENRAEGGACAVVRLS